MNEDQTRLLKGLIQIRTGLSIEELAKEIGISRMALSHKINNKKEFKLSEVQAIALKLNLSDDEFIKLFKGQ